MLCREVVVPLVDREFGSDEATLEYATNLVREGRLNRSHGHELYWLVWCRACSRFVQYRAITRTHAHRGLLGIDGARSLDQLDFATLAVAKRVALETKKNTASRLRLRTHYTDDLRRLIKARPSVLRPENLEPRADDHSSFQVFVDEPEVPYGNVPVSRRLTLVLPASHRAAARLGDSLVAGGGDDGLEASVKIIQGENVLHLQDRRHLTDVVIQRSADGDYLRLRVLMHFNPYHVGIPTGASVRVLLRDGSEFQNPTSDPDLVFLEPANVADQMDLDEIIDMLDDTLAKEEEIIGAENYDSYDLLGPESPLRCPSDRTFISDTNDLDLCGL